MFPIIGGQDREILVNQVAQGVNSGASVDFGAFKVGRFSRFAGLLSAVGSFTLRYRMGVDSGTYQVSSTVTVNSGGSTFDVVNYGHHADFSITIANSQVYTVVIHGEPIR